MLRTEATSGETLHVAFCDTCGESLFIAFKRRDLEGALRVWDSTWRPGEPTICYTCRLRAAEQEMARARDRAEYHGWNGSSSRQHHLASARLQVARKQARREKRARRQQRLQRGSNSHE